MNRCTYLPHLQKDKLIITPNIDQADKLIKDNSQISRVNKLIKDILRETKTITVEKSKLRKIVSTNYGHKLKINIRYNKRGAVSFNIVFCHKDDCDKFTKLLYLKNNDKKDIVSIKKSMLDRLTVFTSKDQANKFTKDT